MIKYPENLQKLIDSFKKYPGIGPKNAERMAFYTIMNLKKEDAEEFSQNILNSIHNIKKCSNCGMITDGDLCDICLDEERENKLMIVEGVKDVMAFEKTNYYKGKYHVLHGVISPLNGVSGDDLHLEKILSRLDNEVSVHINDTHPVLCVPELMRLLIDVYGFGWKKKKLMYIE